MQQQSLAAYAAAGPSLFSRVVCNPPFFQRALHSPDAGRSAARHAAPDTLIFAEIVRFSGAFPTADGRLTVLLPMPEITAFAREAGAVGLPQPHDLCCTTGPAAACGRAAEPVAEQELVIRTADDAGYSDAFRALLAEFYLAL